MTARCELWTHAFGWECRLFAGGEMLATQVCRSDHEIRDVRNDVARGTHRERQDAMTDSAIEPMDDSDEWYESGPAPILDDPDAAVLMVRVGLAKADRARERYNTHPTGVLPGHRTGTFGRTFGRRGNRGRRNR